MGFKRERRHGRKPKYADGRGSQPTREDILNRNPGARATYIRLANTYGLDVAERYIDVMRSPVAKNGGAMTDYPSELKRGVEV